jgi:putative resolvase
MERIVGISEAAEALGVAMSTLRRWEASGKMVAEHTVGGHRRYDLAKLRPELFRAAEAAQRKTIRQRPRFVPRPKGRSGTTKTAA